MTTAAGKTPPCCASPPPERPRAGTSISLHLRFSPVRSPGRTTGGWGHEELAHPRQACTVPDDHDQKDETHEEIEKSQKTLDRCDGRHYRGRSRRLLIDRQPRLGEGLIDVQL